MAMRTELTETYAGAGVPRFAVDDYTTFMCGVEFNRMKRKAKPVVVSYLKPVVVFWHPLSCIVLVLRGGLLFRSRHACVAHFHSLTMTVTV
jgi:hypothetical protein